MAYKIARKVLSVLSNNIQETAEDEVVEEGEGGINLLGSEGKDGGTTSAIEDATAAEDGALLDNSLTVSETFWECQTQIDKEEVVNNFNNNGLVDLQFQRVEEKYPASWGGQHGGSIGLTNVVPGTPQVEDHVEMPAPLTASQASSSNNNGNLTTSFPGPSAKAITSPPILEGVKEVSDLNVEGTAVEAYGTGLAEENKRKENDGEPSNTPPALKTFKCVPGKPPSVILHTLRPGLSFEFREVETGIKIVRTSFECSVEFVNDELGASMPVKFTGHGASKKLAKNDVSLQVLKHLGIIPEDYEWTLESKPTSPFAGIMDNINRLMSAPQQNKTEVMPSEPSHVQSTMGIPQTEQSLREIDLISDDISCISLPSQDTSSDSVSNSAQVSDPESFRTPEVFTNFEKNPITCLNMLVNPELVQYTVLSEDGPDHLKCFKMSVKYGDREFEAEGRSKKLAKANAARKLLMDLFCHKDE